MHLSFCNSFVIDRLGCSSSCKQWVGIFSNSYKFREKIGLISLNVPWSQQNFSLVCIFLKKPPTYRGAKKCHSFSYPKSLTRKPQTLSGLAFCVCHKILMGAFRSIWLFLNLLECKQKPSPISKLYPSVKNPAYRCMPGIRSTTAPRLRYPKTVEDPLPKMVCFLQ